MAGLQDFLGTSTVPPVPARIAVPPVTAMQGPTLPAQVASQVVQPQMQGPPMPPTGLARYVGPQAAGPTSLALQDQARANFASGDTATAVGNIVGAAGSGMLHAIAAPFIDLNNARAADAASLGQTVSHFMGGLRGVQPSDAAASVATAPLPVQIASVGPGGVGSDAVAAPLPPSPTVAVPAAVPAVPSTVKLFGQSYDRSGVLPATADSAQGFVQDPIGLKNIVASAAQQQATGGPLHTFVDGRDMGVPPSSNPTVISGGRVVHQGTSGGGQATAPRRTTQNQLEQILGAPAGTMDQPMPRGPAQRLAYLSGIAQLQSAALDNKTSATVQGALEASRAADAVRRPGETEEQYTDRQARSQANYVQQLVGLRYPHVLGQMPMNPLYSNVGGIPGYGGQ